MFKVFEVGGCVRDEMLGIKSKDVDFTVVGPSSFPEMLSLLEAKGFEVFVSSPETFTVRAKVPDSLPALKDRTRVADFVLARRESSASTGRMPDEIEPGSLMDDLARRDFTVNAMARDPETGEIIDPFGGIRDLNDMTLRFVGDPMKRIEEDPLRVVRGLRFVVTKGFHFAHETAVAITCEKATELLSGTVDGKRVVSLERIQGELDRMFASDTLGTLMLLKHLPFPLVEALFPNGIRLAATMKAGKTG